MLLRISLFLQPTMNNVYKGKAKYISATTAMLVFVALTLVSRNTIFKPVHFYKTLTVDTIPPKKNPLKVVPPKIVKDSSVVKSVKPDTTIVVTKTDSFNIRFSKDSLDAPVVYHADDSMVFDVPANKITLYGKETKTVYKDNELTAPGIEFDQKSNTVMAFVKLDSNGKVIAFPTFTQADFKSISDTIKFNMKTGKGLTKGTYTNQGEMFIYGEKIKKVDENVFYAYRGRFTTCNLDTPHFAFVSKKIKFINKKMAITGPVHPEFEGVPVPVILPFGIYPLSQGRHSGILAPTFTANEQQGLALEGLGYYKVLSDNFDVVLRGTIYSYGGWSASLSPRYYKRYHYQGNVNLDVINLKSNFKGDPDYTNNKAFNFVWNHNVDTKSRPGVTFSANVNFGSSKFNQSIPNNNVRNFQNRTGSTINYAKVWKDKPFNLTVTANHSQNNNTKLFDITLPVVNFNVNTLYPFRKKEQVGELKWYENIGIALNTSARSQTTFSDSKDTLFTKVNGSIGNQVANNFKWGASHNVPINLSLPPMGPLQISPSISYAENWYQEKYILNWNDAKRKLDTISKRGFYSARDMSFGVGLSTRIFGMFGFGKNAKVQAIRHELRPTISMSYKPNMNSRSYYTTQIDTFKNVAKFSYYQNSLYGAFSDQRFGGIGFGLDNNISMKVRNRKDTAEGTTKKISLIDGLSISGNYNFLKDSFQLSTFSISARSSLFDKINISASATLDPYQVDTSGKSINRLVWRDKIFTLGRFLGANATVTTSFQGGDKNKKKAVPQNQISNNGINPLTGLPMDENQQEAAYIRNNPAQYADFSIPWSVNIGYTIGVSKFRKTTQVNQDVNINGTLNLTPRWQMAVTAFYNITQKQLGTMAVSISREMHCWQMAISISPVSPRYFTITISPKSGLLQDLKVNRTRYFYDL